MFSSHKTDSFNSGMVCRNEISFQFNTIVDKLQWDSKTSEGGLAC